MGRFDEIRLLAAIISRALDDAAGRGITKPTPFRIKNFRRDAIQWLTQTRWNGVGSLTWYCRTAGIDPEPIRASIRERLKRDAEPPLNGRKPFKTKDLGERDSLPLPLKRQDRVFPSDRKNSGRVRP